MKTFEFKKFIRSFHHAFRGVIRLLENEQNARVHAIVTILVGVLAYIFEVSRLEAAILFMAIIMVFAMEIMNTAVEKMCDFMCPDLNGKVKYIKDGMAGAVLIASLIAIVVAFLIFLPHIKKFFI